MWKNEMKRLIIRNIGPLKEADVLLSKVNVIIGPQSSGKSCVLKIACYCTWVEKRIELAQSADAFMKDGYFIKELMRFHKLKGYFRQDSYIEYESDFTKFSYNNATDSFIFEWKDKRWDFKRPKVSYIPAERNMVAAIPNWFDVKLYDDNIQSFMADWDRARKVYTEQLDILNLGVSYRYDAQTNSDKVQVDDDTTLELTNTSSGLQSLIPLFVHLNYINKDVYNQPEAKSLSDIQVSESFLLTMYTELFRKADKTGQILLGVTTSEAGKRSIQASPTIAHIGPFLFQFSNKKYADECRDIFERYVNTDHTDVFLEEPENNLFPPTQAKLVDWLMEMSQEEHGSNLFIATHSPYIMTAFLERDLKDFKLFIESVVGGKSVVKTASEEDVQEIYDDGIDLFYNIESYT